DLVLFAGTVARPDAARGGPPGLAESYAPPAWQSGARAFTSGLVNVSPRLSLDLLEALRDADLRRVTQLQDSISEFEAMRARNGSANNVSVVKEAMHQLGLCDRSVRPPSAVLSDAERVQISRMITEWGLTA